MATTKSATKPETKAASKTKAKEAKTAASKPASAKAAKPAAKAPAKTARKAPAQKAPAAPAPSGTLLARVEAVRMEQRQEGHFDCFAKAYDGFCDQMECRYHEECLDLSRRITA